VKLVAEALVRDAEDAESTPINTEEILVVASVVVPVTDKRTDERLLDTRLVVVAFVAIRLVVERLVNVGFAEKLIVLPLHERLDPSAIRVDGVV
jgi:hypothetical protein